MLTPANDMKTTMMLNRGQARGVHKVGVMNSLEESYRDELNRKMRRGEIRAFFFEAVTLRLANNTRYTPDFLVIRNDYAVEFHEVKGHWEEDARVKIKVAVAMYPFIFRAFTQPSPGAWVEERFEKPTPPTAEELRHIKVCDIVNSLNHDQLVALATEMVSYALEDAEVKADYVLQDATGVDLSREKESPF